MIVVNGQLVLEQTKTTKKVQLDYVVTLVTIVLCVRFAETYVGLSRKINYLLLLRFFFSRMR